MLVVVFAHAGLKVDYGQQFVLKRLDFGTFAENSVFPMLFQISYKLKGPVKSVDAAEVVAMSQGIDEGNVFREAAALLFGTAVDLIKVVDSKDLFTYLSTQKNSIDRSTRSIVNTIRFEYETGGVDEVIWVPRSVNLPDPGTKTDSSLALALQLMKTNGVMLVDLYRAESLPCDRSPG